MKVVETKGKTIEDAIDKALKELDTTRDKVKVDVLDVKRMGILSFFGYHSHKVRVTCIDHDVNKFDIMESSIKMVKNLLKAMNLHLDVTGTVFSGRIYIKINGEDAKFIIGRSGEVLYAFEDFINLSINKEFSTNYSNKIRIDIDADNYKLDREEKLKDMLKTIVKNVLETEESYVMRPMPRRDRKIVHFFIDGYEGLETFSKGTGKAKYIVIAKKNKNISNL